MAAIAQPRTAFQKINPYLPSSRALNILGVVGLVTAGYFAVQYAKGRAFSAAAISQSTLGVALIAGSLYCTSSYLKKSRTDLAEQAKELGFSTFKTKDFAGAIPPLTDSLIAWKQLGDKNVKEIAILENLLGICFRGIDNFQKAIEHYSAGLKIASQDPSLEEHEATILHNLGIAHICAKEANKAIPHLEKALAKKIKLHGQKDLPQIAAIHAELGHAHKQIGDRDKAKLQFIAAQGMYQRLGNNESAAKFAEELRLLGR